MAKEEFYSLSNARNNLSRIIRNVSLGMEVAIITVDGRPTARIQPFSANERVTRGTTYDNRGMTVEQIRHALESTKDNPEMLRKMLELFV
jgi:prevent-host-death family protein